MPAKPTKPTSSILDEVYAVIESRRGGDAKKSWTARLLLEAPQLPARKLGEEAAEAVVAAMQGDRKLLVAEAADVMYHLLVVLAAADIPLEELWNELAERRKQSGVDEKSARDNQA
ncbi:MAG: phosphoribosyl-ATP diphosphatase [Proteobacteria bacterium]|nr:phosphoribosyl-ATP diphosphatase [Pseudomonadota bacterium]